MHSEHLHFINMHDISINSCMHNLHVIKLLVFSELCDSKKEERVSSNPPLFLRLNLFHVTLPMAAADCSIQPPLSLLPAHHPPQALSHLPASSSGLNARLCLLFYSFPSVDMELLF